MEGSKFTPDSVEENEAKPKYEVKPLLAEHAESGPKGLVVNGEPVPFVAAPTIFPPPSTERAYPVITESEKLAVRDSQFRRTQIREQAQVAIQNADQQLSMTINQLAQKYKIDPKTSDFNMVTLTFVEKK